RPMVCRCFSITWPSSAVMEGMNLPPGWQWPARGSDTAVSSFTREVTSQPLRKAGEMMRVSATAPWKWPRFVELIASSQGRGCLPVVGLLLLLLRLLHGVLNDLAVNLDGHSPVPALAAQ